MNKNCLILIDVREDFPLYLDTINYIEKFKPAFVINANYPIDIWVMSSNNPIKAKKNSHDFLGRFDNFGELNVRNNHNIENYLIANNIKYYNIIDPLELINLDEFKLINSITILGSSWSRCLHQRPLGFNFLPKIINLNIKILTYSLGCCQIPGMPVVDKQIKNDKDWIPTPYTNLYEYIGTR